jgi:hypothetical protein
MTRSKDFIRRYVMHNMGLKILSLLLAIGLWFAIAIGKLH